MLPSYTKGIYFNTVSKTLLKYCVCICVHIYTGCNRRNGPNFGRVFLRSNYTDITQNTYIQSSMVTEILAREMCGLLCRLRTVICPWRHTRRILLTFNASHTVALRSVKAATQAPFWCPSCLCSFKTEGKMEHDDGHRRPSYCPFFSQLWLSLAWICCLRSFWFVLR